MTQPIEVTHLTKRFGRRTAVDDLSFSVPAGSVTGFVGPNGAGKSTTMRMILGLDRPYGGRALVNGRRYADLGRPLREAGALLDASAVHRADARPITCSGWRARTGSRDAESSRCS